MSNKSLYNLLLESSKVDNSISKCINGLSMISSKSPLVLDFYRALKNQKVFGRFCAMNKIASLTYAQKTYILRLSNIVEIGDITVQSHEGDGELLDRLKLLERMIIHRGVYKVKYPLQPLHANQALWYYAKEYFKNKGVTPKHSLYFHQLLYGTITTVIGLIMISSLIYYFWGGKVLCAVEVAILIYSCIGIYKLRKI